MELEGKYLILNNKARIETNNKENPTVPTAYCSQRFGMRKSPGLQGFTDAKPGVGVCI